MKFHARVAFLWCIASLCFAERAQSQSIAYSDIAKYVSWSQANGALKQGNNTIAAMMLDDINVAAGFAGKTVMSLQIRPYSDNTVAVVARPRIRFWAADGPDGTPGTYLAALDFKPTTFLPAKGTSLQDATLRFAIPANGKFWAGIEYDDAEGTTGITETQLNGLGLRTFDPPTVGSSNKAFSYFIYPGGTLIGVNNPPVRSWSQGANPLNFGWQFTTNIAWGARVLVQLKDQSVPHPDYLVAATPDGILFSSDIHIDDQNNVTTDDPIPYDNVQSITVLPDDPGATVKDGGPAERSLNKYCRTDGNQKTVEITGYTVANGWSYNYYTLDTVTISGKPYPYKRISYTANKNTFSVYAIPRVKGTDPISTVYANLTAAALHAQIPRQILYAIAWKEAAIHHRPGENFHWQQFGYYTYFQPGPDGVHGKGIYKDDPDGDLRTIVTLDGGIGIVQTTNKTNIGTETTTDGILTRLYNLASDRSLVLSVGTDLLSHNWGVLNKSGEAEEFLEHWYNPVKAYNGIGQAATDYANSIWQLIASVPYRATLPATQRNDPGVQPPPAPLSGSQPQFADWNFDGKLDLQLTKVTMTTAVDSHNKVIGVNLSVQLTPLNGFFAPTLVRVTLKPPSGKTVGPVTLKGTQNVFTGQAPGAFVRGKYTLMIDITASSLEKRAVYAITY